MGAQHPTIARFLETAQRQRDNGKGKNDKGTADGQTFWRI